MIKSLPQWVASYGAGTSGGGFGMDRPTTQGGNIGEALVSVTHIRELNTIIMERDLALERVSAEKKTVEDSLAIVTAELITLKAEKKMVDESLASLKASHTALGEKAIETKILCAKNEQLQYEILLLCPQVVD